MLFPPSAKFALGGYFFETLLFLGLSQGWNMSYWRWRKHLIVVYNVCEGGFGEPPPPPKSPRHRQGVGLGQSDSSLRSEW